MQIRLTKSAQNTVLRLQIELTKSVTYTYGKVTLTWFKFDFRRVLLSLVTAFYSTIKSSL
ncbi:hypothetical protein E3V14_00635 [Streptococcus pseudopneumoniae]|uniref:Uncharacterized protein n=1 Tax=Streptococcus pseudopneumoniae TaxID=257758 RepID=A0A3A4N335_9STRE|nr:hypothetical protein [Streptococcus pseudopneumoniae]RJP12935.1 hypothetical protein C5O69_05105 [Streptococcus pseudopneumoniae]RJP83574.1 hypothetical protein C5O68_03440 [Streptococcus pseudopneumoniae]TMR53394.1 hypothetical protein E3V25_04435 [Streptococcus pseudopneumoniae]TMR54698.1 hypothetical protein E3V14_00635 [Streptococcus pseudopneumoniae]